MLTDEQVKRFQTLYEHRFGEKLLEKDARVQGAQLLGLLRIIYQPITQGEREHSQERQKQIFSNN